MDPIARNRSPSLNDASCVSCKRLSGSGSSEYRTHVGGCTCGSEYMSPVTLMRIDMMALRHYVRLANSWCNAIYRATADGIPLLKVDRDVMIVSGRG